MNVFNRPITLGIIAALFFSSTFVINAYLGRVLGQASGDWFWIASLRYLFTILFIVLILLIRKQATQLAQLLRLFLRHWIFWTITGSIGFGIFYSGLCFSATYAPGWIIATTWQITILLTPLVLLAFSKSTPMRSILFVLLVFFGVVLVNIEQFTLGSTRQLILGAVPVLISALAYPIGNQLVWEAANAGHKIIPHITDPLMKNPLHKLFLMAVGSLPFWILLGCILRPTVPSLPQIASTAIVALLSGLVATTLLFHGRQQCASAREITAMDSTQAFEVIFTVLGEKMFLGTSWPTPVSWFGMTLTVVGQLVSSRPSKKTPSI